MCLRSRSESPLSRLKLNGSVVALVNDVNVDRATPDMRAMVSDVRNFSYCVLDNLTGDGYVPLPTLWWSKVLIHGTEACAGANSGQGIFQARTDGVEAAEGRIVAKSGGSVASPVGVNHLGPRRIAGQTQYIFNHVRATHETPESRAHRSLAITLDVPSQPNSWLETFVIWMPQ